MRLAIVQLNPTVGDLSGNRKLVEDAAARAEAAGAEIAVFPEMVLTGYPPMDLLERDGVDFPNILDTTTEANMTMRKYETLGMSAVPMTYIIDREGKVMNAWYGYQKKKTEEAIKKLKLNEH